MHMRLAGHPPADVPFTAATAVLILLTTAAPAIAADPVAPAAAALTGGVSECVGLQSLAAAAAVALRCCLVCNKPLCRVLHNMQLGQHYSIWRCGLWLELNLKIAVVAETVERQCIRPITATNYSCAICQGMGMCSVCGTKAREKKYTRLRKHALQAHKHSPV
jgi:hypothetical protein